MKHFGQVCFWILVIIGLTILFGSKNSRYTESFYFVSMLLPVIVGTSYFFNGFLVPKFLFQRKLFKFAVYSIYMLITSLYLQILVITFAFIFLANYQYGNMIPITTDVFMLATTLYCIVFIYGFILLVRKSFLTEASILKYREEKSKQKVDFLTVRINRKMNNITRKDIDYLESLGDYVKIITSSSPPIITKEKISRLSEKLPDSFLRIHRSFIVNSEKIQSFTYEEIKMKNNVQLPISRTYKKSVLETLSRQKY